MIPEPERATDNLVSPAIPVGRDKVITCYGILGMISLATSEYRCILRLGIS